MRKSGRDNEVEVRERREKWECGGSWKGRGGKVLESSIRIGRGEGYGRET